MRFTRGVQAKDKRFICSGSRLLRGDVCRYRAREAFLGDRVVLPTPQEILFRECRVWPKTPCEVLYTRWPRDPVGWTALSGGCIQRRSRYSAITSIPDAMLHSIVGAWAGTGESRVHFPPVRDAGSGAWDLERSNLKARTAPTMTAKQLTLRRRAPQQLTCNATLNANAEPGLCELPTASTCATVREHEPVSSDTLQIARSAAVGLRGQASCASVRRLLLATLRGRLRELGEWLRRDRQPAAC